MAQQETSYDTLFGRMAVEQGLCTDEELRNSLKELKERLKLSPTMLRDVMVEFGYLTESQSERLKKSLKAQKAAAHRIPGYKILGKLGSGAMAIVYQAKQLSLNRMVAIKVLPKRFSENPEYVERFFKEGQAAAKLNHTNIVQAYDVGQAGGYSYFVMEFVEGKTIYDELSKGKVFQEKEALDIVIQVAYALEHAHAKGLIHRDIKPKNIMTTANGQVKLADMGLARETTDIEAAESEAGKAYGTPYYIAPEQIRGEIDIDGRADIYGLGATFYHMVTGRVPFMADDPSDVMRKHLREKLVPPDHINTILTAGTSEVIEIMMAKKKRNRYKDVAELLEDLQAVRNGQTPLRAHSRMDVSMYKQLENGVDIVFEDEVYKKEIAQRYKMTIVLLSVIIAFAVILIIVLLVNLINR
ncbi:MAG: protein kinase [Phycisphaerae bacterium]|nr:serine/threonine protein kinase [Phycisphaerae bacterium]NIP53777.1 serine/threonine protein kinase [Phycisphaerae bacterium]NIS52722.1 serine/threonine protein kinase [Phycisphaerae bacterium]NIU10159.1 serine/threonine protein kinase [Phycisphaerae bacterium]NIU57871.1 protein kinase [Phycisphaerae bacterium]